MSLESHKTYTLIAPLNALRFFAALSIVVFHFGQWAYPFTVPYIEPYVLLSNVAVTLFFVLSGFIMVHVYGTRLSTTLNWESVRSFYRARIARIVPVYMVALGATLLYFLYRQELWTLQSLLLHLTFLQAWIPHQALTLNFPGWSLSAEMFFYALFPLMLFFLSKKTWRQRVLIATSLWLLSNMTFITLLYSYAPTPELADVSLKFFPLLHLNSFVIGIVAGLWFTDKKRSVGWLAVLAVVLLLLYPFLAKSLYFPIRHNGLLAPLFAVIIIGIAQSKRLWTKVLAWKPFVVGGDISYGIYILQAPVYWWTYEIYQKVGVEESLGESGRFFTYITLLIIVSLISRYTIEAWGTRFLRGSKKENTVLQQNT